MKIASAAAASAHSHASATLSSSYIWVLLGSLIFHFAGNISSVSVLSAVSVVSHQV
jgi:hypothetical protein